MGMITLPLKTPPLYQLPFTGFGNIKVQIDAAEISMW